MREATGGHVSIAELGSSEPQTDHVLCVSDTVHYPRCPNEDGDMVAACSSTATSASCALIRNLFNTQNSLYQLSIFF